MRRAPGYAAFTVLVLALGIGTVTAMFTIAYAVLLKPLPFEADRRLYQPVVKTMVGSDTQSLPYDEIKEWQRATQGMAEVAFNGGGLNIADGPVGAVLITEVEASRNLFSILGAKPMMERGFSPEEQEAGRADVVVLSYALWQQDFGGDPNVLLLLCNTGRSAQALYEIGRAHRSDPEWPPIYITEMYVVAPAHKNQRAIEAAYTLINLMPDWPLAYDQSGWAYWYAGRPKEAVEEWIRMARLEHDEGRLALEQNGLRILASKGATAYAQMKLAAIGRGAGSAHPNDFQLAEWQLSAGLDDAALDSMRQMIREHDPEVLQFAPSPAYARLHGKPAFNDLLGQIGLPRFYGD